MLSRRNFLGMAGLIPLSFYLDKAYANNFPTSTIKIIVPLQAGGAADTSARIIATGIQKNIKKPIIVQNKPGGSHLIGMQNLKSSASDGYTLIALNTGMSASQVTLNNYNLTEDLSLITTYGKTPVLFCVPENSPFNSIHELIEYAKKNPTKLNFGSVGTGALEHLWVSMLGLELNTEFTHIPYKGMPDAMIALAQGELDFVPCVISAALPFLQKGNVKTFGIISDTRSPQSPDIPTLKEQGINIAPMEYWSGFAAPKNTPPEIVEQLKNYIHTVLLNDETQRIIQERGTIVMPTKSPDEYYSIINNELAWMSNVIEKSNIQIK